MKRFFLSLLLLFSFLGVALAQVPQLVQERSQLPVGAVGVTGSGTGTTGAISATLAAASGKTTYICGFSYTGTNATAAQNGSVTVTGVITGTMSFGFPTIATGVALLSPSPLVQNFYPCVPGSAVNTAIVVNGPALGAGAPLATVAAWGYQQ